MKAKNLLFNFTLFLFSTSIWAQTCPSEIQSQSTSTALKLVITPGTCGEYPQTIGVDESGTMSTFDKDKCNGSNLDYVLLSGTAPTDPLNITIDFGSGVVCTYVNGQLQVLGLDHLTNANSHITINFDNPVSKENLIISSEKQLNGVLQVYDLKGSKLFDNKISNENKYNISTNNWATGTYIVKFKSQAGIGWVKKVAF